MCAPRNYMKITEFHWIRGLERRVTHTLALLAIGRVTKSASRRFVLCCSRASMLQQSILCVSVRVIVVLPERRRRARAHCLRFGWVFSPGRWIEADKMTNNRDKHGLYVVTPCCANYDMMVVAARGRRATVRYATCGRVNYAYRPKTYICIIPKHPRLRFSITPLLVPCVDTLCATVEPRIYDGDTLRACLGARIACTYMCDMCVTII